MRSSEYDSMCTVRCLTLYFLHSIFDVFTTVQPSIFEVRLSFFKQLDALVLFFPPLGLELYATQAHSSLSNQKINPVTSDYANVSAIFSFVRLF